MQRFFLFASLLFLALAAPVAARAQECRGELVYMASLNTAPGAGVAGARFDSKTGHICGLGVQAPVSLPSWVLAHPTLPVIYATSEMADPNTPQVFAYHVDAATGALHELSRGGTGGAGATFFSIDTRSRTMFATHWISGHVSALPLAANGAVEAPASVQLDEMPPNSRGGPRSHSAILDPTRRFVLVADYAADRFFVYRYDAATRQLTKSDPWFEQMPPASSPRHFLFHPNGKLIYLLNQRANEVRAYRWLPATGRVQLEQSISTLAKDFTGRNDAAEIALSPDARFLYVSNRGEDTIAVFAVDRAGKLTERQRVASGGKTPRAFAIDPSGKWALVGNQASNEVRVFARDRARGTLTATDNTISVDMPAGFAFPHVAR